MSDTNSNSNGGIFAAIAKFYPIVFVIYGLTFVIDKFFHTIPILNEHKIFIAICFSLITLAIGIYLLVLAAKKITADNSKLFKKSFIIPFSTIFVLIIGYTFFLLGNGKEKHTSIKESNKKRIVLLLPLNESLKSAYEDGIRQVTGFAEFLKDNSECTRHFEFALYDHSMKFDINLENSIRQEMEEGTKFFICSMSSVALPLSQNFEKIVKSSKIIGEKPILICAVASTPALTLKENLIYRFYIRSQEEGTQLASIANEQGINTATFIAVDDEYGKGAVKEFKTKWKGKMPVTDGILVSKLLTVEEIKNLITDKIKTIPAENRQAIFICHYGNGIDNVVTALDATGVKAILLATSTISIYDWQKPIKPILDKTEWFTCVPDYSSYKTEQKDVIKNFTTYTLHRLTEAILKTNDTATFDSNWKKVVYPDNLTVTWDGNDAVIPMKAVYKKEVNHPSNQL